MPDRRPARPSRMHRSLPALAAALLVAPLLASGPVRADDPTALAGLWIAEGYEVGEAPTVDPAYTGTVTLTVQGESLVYDGAFDGETYHGIGIWHAGTETLALYFVETGSGRHGIAHFVREDGRLDGRWAFADAPDEQGIEVWTPATE